MKTPFSIHRRSLAARIGDALRDALTTIAIWIALALGLSLCLAEWLGVASLLGWW